MKDTTPREVYRPEVSGYPEIPAEDWLRRIGEMARLVSPRGTTSADDPRPGD